MLSGVRKRKEEHGMSVISNTSLGVGFPVANGVFDLERSPGNALARSLGPIDFGSDAVRVAPPYANPLANPPGGVPGSSAALAPCPVISSTRISRREIGLFF